jgi:hypothetical protein
MRFVAELGRQWNVLKLNCMRLLQKNGKEYSDFVDRKVG